MLFRTFLHLVDAIYLNCIIRSLTTTTMGIHSIFNDFYNSCFELLFMSMATHRLAVQRRDHFFLLHAYHRGNVSRIFLLNLTGFAVFFLCKCVFVNGVYYFISFCVIFRENCLSVSVCVIYNKCYGAPKPFTFDCMRVERLLMCVNILILRCKLH